MKKNVVRDEETGIPLRWLEFIDKYVSNGFRPRQAAIDCGYSANSHNNAWRIMQNPEVKKEIERRLRERAMGADEVLVRLAEQARSEFSSYITEDGEIDVAAMIADGKAHLIKRISYDKHGNQIFDFNDPQNALQLLGKHHKLFTNRTEVTGRDGGPIEYQDVDLSPEEEKRRLEARLRLLEKQIEE